MPYLTKPKGGRQCPRQVYVNKSTAEIREEKAAWKFSNKYKNMLVKEHKMAEGHSSHQQGPYFYQEGGKTFASLPIEMIQGIQQCPHFEEMKRIVQLRE